MKGRFVPGLIPVASISGVLFYLSSLESPAPPSVGLLGEDKILHAGAYFVLCLASLYATNKVLPGRTVRTQRVVACIYTLLFAISDELHQASVPGRSCDFLDLVADVAGALIALWVVRVLAERRITRRGDTPGVQRYND